jgi:hypothetical protein
MKLIDGTMSICARDPQSGGHRRRSEGGFHRTQFSKFSEPSRCGSIPHVKPPAESIVLLFITGVDSHRSRGFRGASPAQPRAPSDQKLFSGPGIL